MEESNEIKGEMGWNAAKIDPRAVVEMSNTDGSLVIISRIEKGEEKN